jgi:hypothetical protein
MVPLNCHTGCRKSQKRLRNTERCRMLLPIQTYEFSAESTLLSKVKGLTRLDIFLTFKTSLRSVVVTSDVSTLSMIKTPLTREYVDEVEKKKIFANFIFLTGIIFQSRGHSSETSQSWGRLQCDQGSISPTFYAQLLHHQSCASKVQT